MTLQDTIKTILDFMDYWKKLFPDENFYHQRYEDIINSPNERIKDLLEFCNVEFEKKMRLNFHQSKRPVKTASSEQVRQPYVQDRFRLLEELCKPPRNP